MPTAISATRAGPGGEPQRRGRRGHDEGEQQQGADDLDGHRDGQRQQDDEGQPERPHRHPAGLGDGGVDRGEHQRPGEDGERERPRPR